MRLRTWSLLLACASLTQAAVITYAPIEQTGAQTVNLVVTFDDAAVPNAIQGTVAIVPDAADSDIGDIRAVFFNLINLPADLTPAEVAAGITGANVTSTAVNTQSVGGAVIQPLGPFTIGVEIGTPGAGGDDIQSTTFLIDNSLINPDLTLANFGAVGVRVQSIGAPGTQREGSGKFFDEGGGGPPSEIPEPSTYVMSMTAIAGLMLRRRFQNR